MQITEIYKSLQGESTYAGLPCVFIRLTGCNLRCSWCDSEFSFYGGKKMTVDEVMAEVARLSPGGRPPQPAKTAPSGDPGRERAPHTGLVEITGGEPMLQELEVIALMDRLLADGNTVLLETSGERPLARVPKAVVKIVDVKCPHSGESATFALENLDALQPHDELKFVLADRTDYEFACDFIRSHKVAGRVNAILLSPAFRKEATGSRDSSHCLLDPQQLAEWIVADNVPARLSLQIHKLIWDPATKGV
jgi:7-carboxy-7-deazaguanine synthase